MVGVFDVIKVNGVVEDIRVFVVVRVVRTFLVSMFFQSNYF